MTTIAYDGKTLATDSLTTAGDTAFGSSKKIHKLKDGWVALCGDVSWELDVIAWLNGGPTPVLGENDNVGGLVIRKKGEVFEFGRNLRLFHACVPWAGGSGESFALAALSLGYNAEQAVELACKLDIRSGGAIQKVEPWN